MTLEKLKALPTGRKFFYVYVLRDPRNALIFYVGCTRYPATRGLYPSQYGQRTAARIREIRAAGLVPERDILGQFGSAKHAGFQERYAAERLCARGVEILNHSWGRFYDGRRSKKLPVTPVLRRPKAGSIPWEVAA